jgi:hypothetical protein
LTENYVGIYECKDVDGAFYAAVSFGSRTTSLKDSDIEHLKKEATKYGIDTSKMRVIKQEKC